MPAAPNVRSGVIYYALAAVKNVGRQAMDHVVEVREAGGPFNSLSDFARRIDPRLVNKRAFENLVRAGAFDALHPNRRQLVEIADRILGERSAHRARPRGGPVEPVRRVGLDGATAFRCSPPTIGRCMNGWAEEFSAIGFYLSGHPLDAYAKVLKRLGVTAMPSCWTMRAALGQGDARRHRDPKSGAARPQGDPFAFVGFSDPTGMFEVMLFSEVLSQARALLEAGRSVVMKVVGDWTDDELKLRALSAEDLNAAAAEAGEGLKIRLSDPTPLPLIAARLKQSGKGLVTLVVPVEAHKQDVEIVLPKRVQVTPELKSVIASLGGVVEVETV